MTTIDGFIVGCLSFSFSYSRRIPLSSGEITRLHLNQSLLHPTKFVSPSKFWTICTSWTHLLLGFGLGWVEMVIEGAFEVGDFGETKVESVKWVDLEEPFP
jgi:hypothetical protein